MIRTGTLVVVRWTFAAILAATTGVSAAENLPSLARGTDTSRGWTTSDGSNSSDVENPFRNSPGAAAAWQPVRDEPAPPEVIKPKPVPVGAKPAPAPAKVQPPAKAAAKPAPKAIAKAAPTQWMMPTQSGATNQANPANTKQAARAPKTFTPPADAQQIAKAAPKLDATESRKTVNAGAKPQAASSGAAGRNTGADLYTGSAARGAAPVQPNPTSNAASNNASNSNTNQARQTGRPPRPTPTGARGLLDTEGWIRPLQQVAYQVSGAAGEEEIPMPGGQKSVMSRSSGGPSMRGGAPPMPNNSMMEGDSYMDPGGMSSMPSGNYGDGWIGPPGGQCCDGSCGPDGCGDGCCGPMCGDACEPGCGCSSDCPDDLCMIGVGDDESCHTIRMRIPKCQEVMVYGGVHGFKGPFDRSRDSGNFGFQEGINIGAKLPFTDWGYQIGYQAIESQLNGDIDTGIGTPFTQNFFTAGVFHRTRDGMQGGLAWDQLIDDRETTTDFHQIRYELSFVDCGCHEFGVMGGVHLADEVLFSADDDEVNSQAWQSADQFLLFYRMHGCTGGEGRFFGGITDDSDGIIGADFLLPLKDCWSLQTGFTYLIPDAHAGTEGARQEAWNLGINLVWHWKGHARECHSNPYRPLFNVADNGSMIIDDRP